MITYRLPRVPGTTLLFTAVLLSSCASDKAPRKADPAFAPYVAAFTAGHISARASIIVRLADDIMLRDSSEIRMEGLFRLDPDATGTVVWEDERTLRFQPTERLRSGTTYSVAFQLGQVTRVPKGLEVFRFQVDVFAQGIDAQISELRALSSSGLTWQQLIVAVRTSDDATGQDLSACFTAQQDGRKLSMSWEHEPNGRFHRLLCDSVHRGESSSRLVVRWNSMPVGVEGSGELPFDIPSINELRLVSTSTNSEGEQVATLLFGDPLDPRQDLTGLAGLSGSDRPRLAVDGNRLLIYPRERLRGAVQAFVAAGLVNVNRKPLGQDILVDLLFEELKPAVRMVGKGTILPSTDGLLMPFEAVNLSAVDVKVVRIHTANVAQFLQVNRLDGNRELARVGRIVTKKTLPLGGRTAPVPGRWERHFLKLDELVKPEPGAIYRVQLGFRKQHSIYPCGDQSAAATSDAADRDWAEGDDGQWDRIEEYAYYYDDDEDYDYEEDYDWRQRDEPCSPSYYGSRRSVSRNILASDLGLIAKRGTDGGLWVACSDLRSAAPMGAVRIEVLNLQRQVLGEAVTDGEGLVTFPTTTHLPFLLVASKGAQRGYLKLDEGSALNVSEFNVEGANVDRGLKGFLYGERGVWRPGDTLFLTFMMQDGRQQLPKDHPVVLELTDPRGRLDQKHVRNASTGGVYAFRCTTASDAPTGLWHATVRVGGTTFHKAIRIETVKPNRLKIVLDAGGERLMKGPEPSRIALRSEWLHGAPAKELQARVTLTMARMEPDFKTAKGYVFNDLGTSLGSEERVVFDGRLGKDGRVEFPFDLVLNAHAPAAVRANLVTRVFEAGGDASIDRVDLPYYPYSSYVGVQAPDPRSSWGNFLTDTTYAFQVMAVDAAGRPLPAHRLKAHVVKVTNNWWWDGDEGGGTNYMTAPSSQLVHEQELTTDAKGRAVLPFRVSRPLWGRFVVRLSDPRSGHVCAVQTYVDWPSYEGRSRREAEPAAAVLSFNSDKKSYSVGETCELIIPSGGTGRALVSLETGTRILDARWVDMRAKEVRHRFAITADMAPTVYAHVTLLQPHANTVNDLPIRLYGVVPIAVEDPLSHLLPEIKLPAEVRTDERFNVQVFEKEGRAMTYTLAIVDEGLLDLTRFKTPDPWSHFYAREALGVRTWDLYDQVIGAVGKQLQRVLALGGSDEGRPVEAAKADRFKPVVRFAGPYQLGPGAKADHRFTLSNYVGRVRVMVVAGDGTSAYGHAERSLPVRKPVMVLATMPRVVGPGETVELPVNVFAMDSKVRDVMVRVETNAFFKTDGPASQRLRFDAPGDQVATFRVKVAENTGVGRVKVVAEAAGEKAEETIEIHVRNPNVVRTEVEQQLLDRDGTWRSTPVPLGTGETNTAYLEVSTIPPVDIGRRLQYLIGYPHGCVEQTTSKAFPQLYLDKVMEMDARLALEMRANVDVGIRRLRQFQQADGSFSYWPGTDQADDWSNVYAGHFLVEAERLGFAVPADMRRNWLAHAKRMATVWNATDRQGWTRGRTQLLQAYRLYVLALGKSADAGAMNRLRTTPHLEFQARWSLAAAYALNGQTNAAEELIKGLVTVVNAYADQGYTYGSDLRDESLIAETLMHLGKRVEAASVVERIARRLSGENWYSTQSTAFGLMAVSRFAQGEGLDKGMRYVLEVDGKGSERFSEKAMARHDLPVPDGKWSVSIRNKGGNPLHIRLVRSGIPLPGAERPSAEGLVMQVEYRHMDGTALASAQIEQGTDFMAVVTVAHPGIRGTYQQLALTQVFPSGWEIRNARMEGTEGQERDSHAEYRDVRDDRVMTYFHLAPGHKATFHVKLNAAYMGTFYLPPAVCEAMYDHTVNARSEGKWVQVLPTGSVPQASR